VAISALARRARIAREALWMLLLPLLVVVPLAFAAIWLALRAGLAPLQRWRERLAARGVRGRSAFGTRPDRRHAR